LARFYPRRPRNAIKSSQLDKLSTIHKIADFHRVRADFASDAQPAGFWITIDRN
jgi:hypothetical protein